MNTTYAIILSAFSSLAALFFVDTVTPQTLRVMYRDAGSSGRQVRILVMPGHESTNGGTMFRNLKERDLAVDIGERIVSNLSKDPKISATLGRTTDGWYPPLSEFLTENFETNAKWREEQFANMDAAVANGSVTRTTGVGHATATPVARINLYGINKWASENQYDIMLSLHFNDYAGRKPNRAGTYKGFAVYIPEKQFSNARAARDIGNRIAYELQTIQQKSTLRGESEGVIEDQELIATGANNSADTANILIEYGYIYEPQFQDAATRNITFDAYAEATSRAIISYLDRR